MKLTNAELDFLSAWAREEREPACYGLPAHRLQLAHCVSGAQLQLVMLIKAWTVSEGKKDRDVLDAANNPQPSWPWATSEQFADRLAEVNQWRTRQAGLKQASGVEIR